MSPSHRPERLRFILDIATEALCRDGGTEFNRWAELMQAFAEREEQPQPTAKELLWVWKALRSDYELNSAFGFLEPAPAWVRARAREESAQDIIEALPAGIIFSIQLRPATDLPEMQELYKKRHDHPLAFVRLDEPLCFRPGKACRLECCPVKCTLITPACEATCEELAALMFGVNEADVHFLDKNPMEICISCTSLNHAYMLASKRFERGRRSHGGRIYDSFVICYPEGQRPEHLDMIRMRVERGQPALKTKPTDTDPCFPWA